MVATLEMYPLGFLLSWICWTCGFLLPERGFATLVQRFRCHWIHFVTGAFSDLWYLCPEISSCKIGGQFGLLRLKAFGIHLNSGCKTALWTVLIQASLCDHMSTRATRAWKPDSNRFWLEFLKERGVHVVMVSARLSFDCKKRKKDQLWKVGQHKSFASLFCRKRT